MGQGPLVGEARELARREREERASREPYPIANRSISPRPASRRRTKRRIAAVGAIRSLPRRERPSGGKHRVLGQWLEEAPV